jgi:hypothetical protein
VGCAMMAAYMGCPDKQALQRQCTAAWEAYEAQLHKAGLRADPGTAVLSVAPLYRLGHLGRLDPATGKPALSPVYATAVFLREEHARISRELSRHLASHRC